MPIQALTYCGAFTFRVTQVPSSLVRPASCEWRGGLESYRVKSLLSLGLASPVA
jgi:hypothetical protein